MTERKTILIVDDIPDNIKVIAGLLKDQYATKAATSGEKALQLVRAGGAPDLILLDIMMPGMDGYAVCAALKADVATHAIPVIFLTAKSEEIDEVRGFSLGAVDYITKPISPPVLMARVKTQLQLKEARDFLNEQNRILEHKVKERTRELSEFQDVTMLIMGSLAETRDNETGAHIQRTQHYVQTLAKALVTHPRFAETLTPEFITLLFKSAPLHDIGKIGIPDRILLKPGALTPEEFQEMKKHPQIGGNAIEHAEHLFGGKHHFLMVAKDIAYHHHEKWDGSGYPHGLRGEEIPVAARLMAVADVYDALINARVYKPPFSHQDAAATIRAGSGVHFDPAVVEAFTASESEFLRIAAQFVDGKALVPTE